MISKLKKKFILLSMTSLFVLLAVVVVGMNLINYHSVVTEADKVLSVMSQNNGDFPDFLAGTEGRLPHNLSPETPYESRYFTVTLDENGGVISTQTGRIKSVDDEAAAEYAAAVLKKNRSTGFFKEFRYVKMEQTDGTRIIFLDCGRKLDAFFGFLAASCGVALAGYVIVFAVVVVLSGKIIKPIAESYEKQKRFITDAGHEIKTPLTIISANAEILEMELGENESLADIRQQTRRLRSLTDDLVMLSRMEESADAMPKIEFPLSDTVSETALPFRTVAAKQGKEFVCRIEPMLSLNGNSKAIQQLISIFLDNALKYSPAGGTVMLSLTKQNRTILLSVFNTAEAPITPDQLDHVFDRFYRADASRNSQTGGHGIGLSVAKAIVCAHGGKIQAHTKDGHSFQITAAFPG